MSIETEILKHVSLGDIVTYRDESGNTASGKVVGWQTAHSGQKYLLIDAETPIPLYRILSRQRGQGILHFRKQPATMEA